MTTRTHTRHSSITSLLPKAQAWQASHSASHYTTTAPYLLKYRSSQWFILITVCIALFTDSFIYGVLVPVLPFILSDRGHIAPGMEQLWTSALFAAFGGAILIASPICGWYADKSVSRQTPLLLGLPVMAASTALLGASESVWVLLVSRILQGFSAAIVWTVGLALTVDTVGKDELAQWMGTALSSSSVGLVISPLLGGVVYSKTGLWGVLGMMIGLIGLNIILISLMIEKRTAKQYILIDTSSRPHSTSEQHRRPSTQVTYETFGHFDFHITPATAHHPSEASLRKASTTDVDSTAPIPLHSKSNLPPIFHLIRSPRILASTYGVFTQFGLLASFDAFLPLFVKRRFGWDSLGAGLIFLCIAIPALTGPLAGKLADQFGNRRVAVAGCLLGVPPLLGLRWVGYQETGELGREVILLCALLALIGLFLTLIISPLAADLSLAVDTLTTQNPSIFGTQSAYATAYALFNMAMATATVVGPVIAGTIQDRYSARVVAVVLACWCASAGVVVGVWLRDDGLVEHGRGVGEGEEAQG